MLKRFFNSPAKTPVTQAGARKDKVSPGRGQGHGFDLEISSVPASVIWTSLTINILGLALPLVALQIYDRIIPNEATSTLAFLIFGLGFVIVLDTVMKVARSYLLGWEAAKLGCASHIDAARRFLGARYDEIDAERPTTWMDRLDALAQVNAANTIPARIVLIDILFVPVYLGLFTMIGGWLVLVPIVVIGPILFVIIRRGETLRQCLAARAEQDQRKQDFLVENLNGILTIKSMAMEPQIQRRYERLQRHSAEINYDVIGLSQSLQSLGTLTSSITTVAVVSSGALIVIAGGNLTVGALAASSLLSGRLMQPLMKGVSVWSDHQARAVATERAAPLAAVSFRERGPDGETSPCRGGIRFTNVDYTPRGAPQPLLRDINIEIEPCQTIGIRPTESAVKDAFLGLVRGHCAATRGTVAIDGRDVDRAWGRELDSQIAMVSNSSGIVEGTILENLTMFSKGRIVERVRHYADFIGLEAAINLLPDGYDTQIGNTVAQKLPNGLLQQIAIVRALAREPAILIFDEAYTSLDSASDPLVIRALSAMAGERTIIISAHRPCYISLADRWFKAADGRLDALETPGREMWNRTPKPALPAAATGRVA